MPELSLRDLRRLIAVVSPATYLFPGTIEENLRMGRPDASQAELEAAARNANMHDAIVALPLGYQTVVGERGVRLSGGQRQRIAIARALLRDVPILILDEALSSVDAESEAAIQDALDRLMRGRTTLIFAHRLSSIIGADRILVAMAAGYHRRLVVTFVLGVARVAALIGVGLLSALVVRAVSRGEPTGVWLLSLLVVAPLAGVLHWLESWLAHDMAYRLLADMRM